jgi:hypothetical protein
MEEKYSWLGTLCAPQEYPMEVYNGAIVADDFSYGFDAIWGTQNTGWGNTGATMNVETQKWTFPINWNSPGIPWLKRNFIPESGL